jgi:two-component system sensor histidine kinase/response regulator
MTVEIAENGHVGVAKVLAAPFDLVLMDVQMPEMDGFEATRQIRRLPGFERLPIVAMTAHAMAGDREKSLAAGMFDHLTKPIELERLQETLLRWIQPRPPAPGEPAKPGPGKPGGTELPEVAGLDTQLGQRLVGGSAKLYLKLLQQFQLEHGEQADQLRAALAEARVQDAERMAHSVKGAAAVLGANALSAASAELEVALRERRADASARLERFAEELDAVCLPLQAHFAQVGEGV